MSKARKGITPPGSTERVARLREGMAEKGLKRWELSPAPHPDDREAIRAFAAKLARKRAKQQAG